MLKRERERVLGICQEVDWLVSQDPGSASMEVLERLRLRMNHLLLAGRLRDAVKVAYRILILRDGYPVRSGGSNEAGTE